MTRSLHARRERSVRRPFGQQHDAPSTLQRLEDRTLFAAHGAVAELSVAQVDAEAAVISDIYVFGDSLSDTGNLYDLTGGLIPPPPYVDGRFSNGPLWIEHLAASLGIELDDAKNFAVGRATTGFENLADQPGIIEFPGMLETVLTYAADVGAAGADPDALYVVWAGANDFLAMTSFDPMAAEATLISAVNNIATAVGTLGSLGAEHILVPSLPDLGLIPRGLISGVSGDLTALSVAFNAALNDALDQLELVGIETIRMDVFALQNQIAADPAAFGLTDAASPYLVAGLGQDPDDFLFFDDQHPTTAGHALIANVARNAIFDSGLLPTISFDAGAAARFTDADGNRVTIRLSGPGSGEVRLLGDQSDAAQIVLTGTTDRSSLHISVAGGKKGGTTVFDIDVDGSLKMINAPHVDIIGDINVSGQLGKVHVDEFVGAAAQMIVIGDEADSPRNRFRLSADDIGDVEVEIDGSAVVIGKGGFAASLGGGAKSALLAQVEPVFRLRGGRS